MVRRPDGNCDDDDDDDIGKIILDTSVVVMMKVNSMNTFVAFATKPSPEVNGGCRDGDDVMTQRERWLRFPVPTYNYVYVSHPGTKWAGILDN